MHQIIRGTTETAEVEIYSNNQLINADGDVIVTVFDADYGTQVGPGGVAFNDPALGKYTFDLDSTYTSLNRVLQVIWSYSINGKQTSQEDFYESYTPYATASDIIDYYGFGTRSSDVNYRSQDEIQAAEFVARMQIENYTGQTFGRKWGDQEIFGNDSDALELVERMLSVEKLYENGILSIDYTANPILNNFGWDIELTT